MLTELLELRLQRLVQGGLVPRPTAASRRRRSCLDTHLAGLGWVTLGPGAGKVASTPRCCTSQQKTRDRRRSFLSSANQIAWRTRGRYPRQQI